MTSPKEKGGGGYSDAVAKRVCGKLKATLEKKSNRNPGEAYQSIVGAIRNTQSDYETISPAYLTALSDANASASDLETKRGALRQAEKSFKRGETTEQQYLLAKSAFETAQATAQRDAIRVDSIHNRISNSGTSEGAVKAAQTKKEHPDSLNSAHDKFLSRIKDRADVSVLHNGSYIPAKIVGDRNEHPPMMAKVHLERGYLNDTEKHQRTVPHSSLRFEKSDVGPSTLKEAIGSNNPHIASNRFSQLSNSGTSEGIKKAWEARKVGDEFNHHGHDWKIVMSHTPAIHEAKGRKNIADAMRKSKQAATHYAVKKNGNTLHTITEWEGGQMSNPESLRSIKWNNRSVVDIFKNAGTSEGVRKAWETRRTDPGLRSARAKFMAAKEKRMALSASDRQKFHGTAKSNWNRDRGLTVPTVPETNRAQVENEFRSASEEYHKAVQNHVAENNGYAPGTREHVTDKEEADARKFLPEIKETPSPSVINNGIWPPEIHRVTLPEDHPSAGKQVVFQKKVKGRTYYDPFAKQTAGIGNFYWDKGVAPTFLY